MKKLLIAYDGSDPAKRALEQTAQLATAMDASVTVVSVVALHPGLARVDDPVEDPVVHRAELAEAKAVLDARKIACEVLEPFGDPATTIERIAVEGGFDTVILGSRGLGTVARALKGSVSNHVAVHSKATVVIVH